MIDASTLADQLDAIERYLKTHQLWSTDTPEPAALASTKPFAVDTLTFEQWLQFLFLPKARQYALQHGCLPPGMSIAPMAKEVYQHQHSELIHKLLVLDHYSAREVTDD
ncbi:YqcC family protein [Salinimonas marina]|uniref:YqcC family protein n=1 Tax=Salinimonas marina TaxID=2785918 RepID=A0A7S9HCZ4_9ALTE|nr:YqcC family protein [Salinimonas marina]QPG05011.1 YqcC family protein [Salinimonas marina]